MYEHKKILCRWFPKQGTLKWIGSQSCQSIEGSPSLLPLPALIFIDLEIEPSKSIDNHWIYSTLSIIQSCPHLTFYWATSYPDVLHSYLSESVCSNLWVGAKIHDAIEAKTKIRSLFKLCGSKYFIICEQLTQPLSLEKWFKKNPDPNTSLLADPYANNRSAVYGIDEVWIVPSQGKHSIEKQIELDCEEATVSCRIFSNLFEEKSDISEEASL